MEAKVTSTYFNHPSQDNSTNYYISLGPRDNAAHYMSQQIGQFPPKRVKYQHCHQFFFFFLVHSSSSTGELSLLSTNQRKGWSNWVNSSQNTSSEVFWVPNIASSSFVELPEAGSRSKSSSKIKNELSSPNLFQVT